MAPQPPPAALAAARRRRSAPRPWRPSQPWRPAPPPAAQRDDADFDDGGWFPEGYADEHVEPPAQPEAQQAQRLRRDYARGHCYGCGVRLQASDPEVGAALAPLLVCMAAGCSGKGHACQPSARRAPVGDAAAARPPCLLAALHMPLCGLPNAGHQRTSPAGLQVAGYVEPERYEVKRRHKQLGQLLCVRWAVLRCAVLGCAVLGCAGLGCIAALSCSLELPAALHEPPHLFIACLAQRPMRATAAPTGARS